MEFLERAREVAEGISFAEEKLKWMVRVPTGQEIATASQAMVEEL